ncbi:MAG: SH3 domain-containing protein [Nitrospinae bacterium]|nr:SH3 domain-containing protein [Nitrospinota bacterium]
MKMGLTFLIFSALLAPQIAFATPKSITIAVKKTSVRSDKQFFAPAIAEVNRLDKLDVAEESGGWYKVKVGGKTGWVHKSATGEESKGASSSLFGGDDASKVSADEVALAGKGFNEKVEKEYKKKNPELNFAAVDKMEKITVKDERIASFVKDGKLSPRELK